MIARAAGLDSYFPESVWQHFIENFRDGLMISKAVISMAHYFLLFLKENQKSVSVLL